MIPTDLLRAEVEAPQVVHVSPKTKTVTLDVRVSLHNTSDEDYVVHTESQNKVLFWHVLDDNQREVLREEQPRGRRPTPTIDELHTRLIPSGFSVHDTATLKLNASKLKDGQTYTIRSNHWGQQAETTFVAIHAKADAKPKGKPGPKPKVKVATKTKGKPDPKPKAQANAKPKGKPGPKPKGKAGTKAAATKEDAKASNAAKKGSAKKTTKKSTKKATGKGSGKA